MATPTSLPASFVSGAVLTAAQMNNLRGAFRVLQVVSSTWTTATASSSSTYADITGSSLSITPSATSSKVLVIYNFGGLLKITSDTGINIKVFRGATELGLAVVDGGFTGSTLRQQIGSAVYMTLDSPNTTSAVTYKGQLASSGNTASIQVNQGGASSAVVLMEISA